MQHVGHALAEVMVRAEAMRKKMQAESATCQASLNEYRLCKVSGFRSGFL